MAALAVNRIAQALKKVIARLNRAQTVNVGFLENATYPDGTPVATIAMIQEFGAPKAHIPPRPFFRNMITAGKTHWATDLGDFIAQTDGDTKKALGLMGEQMKNELMDSITDLMSPPNAPATIARKGFDNPLIDTGHMLNSVDYEVKR